MEHFDVLVVGAGLSGLGAAYHLQQRCPGKTFAIFEGRARLGGTWDLFRYPGVRSDSDMHTLGYSFKPWVHDQAIADGPSILAYLEETAEENGLVDRIRFEHFVTAASWSTAAARWTVSVDDRASGETVRVSCGFLYMCTGYYDYEEGYTPDFPGVERFGGVLVHPQKWTPDIDYRGKRVVVIGSGATAITLVPALADEAAHVTMLQRSPTYILSAPGEDRVAKVLRRALPTEAAYTVTRWKNVLLSTALYKASRRAPQRMARLLVGGVKKALGPDFDVEKHFTPRYAPWDERLCLVPDGDLFEALRSGRASVVTDTIASFTETGIELSSGEHLEADLVVTATGLRLLFMAGMTVTVDGEVVEPRKTMAYKGLMFSDVPNLALSFGYTNASWTLKSDLTAEYVCRLLNHMTEAGHRRCVPRRNDPEVREVPFLDFSAGYVTRALADMPKQGSKAPWRLYQNYLRDIFVIRRGRVDDGVMEFG